MRPLLIFDGLCGFCSYWVSYWLRLTQDGFEAKAYQEVAAEFPDIPLERFQKQIVFVGVDGERAFGAEAAFRILALPGGNPLWLWLYRHVPGYAPAAELAYTLVSRHREAAMRASRWLWGPERVPERHTLPCALFLRLLALIYVAAFVSLATQIRGLAGSEGILPVSGYLDAALTHLGTRAYWQVPTLFWFSSSDTALVTACILGALAALASLIGGRWTPPLLLLCYVLYLSLFYAGQDFMHFQWDTLLLETGFLAVFLPSRSVLVVWLFRWLLFRFVFGFGLRKALERRSNLGILHGTGLPLRDPAAPNTDCLVRSSVASMLSTRLHICGPRHRARGAFPVLCGPPATDAGGLDHPGVRAGYPSDGQLQFFQPAGHELVCVAVR